MVEVNSSLVISIHTPAWGVTVVSCDLPHGIENFNPHPRVGGDVCLPPINGGETGISIHTPRVGGDLDNKASVL